MDVDGDDRQCENGGQGREATRQGQVRLTKGGWSWGGRHGDDCGGPRTRPRTAPAMGAERENGKGKDKQQGRESGDHKGGTSARGCASESGGFAGRAGPTGLDIR